MGQVHGKIFDEIKFTHYTTKNQIIAEVYSGDTPAQQIMRGTCPVYQAVLCGWEEAQHATLNPP